MISVNDTYKSREELLEAFSDFTRNEKHKFVLKERKKMIYIVCKAHKECYCDAQITAHFKKRENVFQIKKMKTAHKCPQGYHFYPDFLEKEIQRRSSTKLLGEIIKQMNESGIKIGYSTAWRIANRWRNEGEYKIGADSAENIDNNGFNVTAGTKGDCKKKNSGPDTKVVDSPSNLVDYIEDDIQGHPVLPESMRKGSSIDSVTRNDPIRKAIVDSGGAFYLDEGSESSEEDDFVLKEALKGFRGEFFQLNPKCKCEVSGSMIYISFPFLQYLRNVLDLKIQLRKRGCVVYGIGYDPVDKPIIVSFAVGDVDVESALKFFFKNEPKVHNYNDIQAEMGLEVKKRRVYGERDKDRAAKESDNPKKSTSVPILYMTEYEDKIVNALEGLGVNYFVKTRSICKRFNLSETERVFRIVNYNMENDLNLDLNPSRYIVKDHMFGINNFGEVDLDFIFYAVYNFSLLDCVTSVLKLTTDNLKERNYKSFGDNVLFKLERNKKIGAGLEGDFQVDIENFWCSCGKYQMFLIPCAHACSLIMRQGKEPLDFVSSLYSPDIMKFLESINPVVDVPVRCQLDRFLLRRGPGRPKKQNLVSEKR